MQGSRIPVWLLLAMVGCGGGEAELEEGDPWPTAVEHLQCAAAAAQECAAPPEVVATFSGVEALERILVGAWTSCGDGDPDPFADSLTGVVFGDDHRFVVIEPAPDGSCRRMEGWRVSGTWSVYGPAEQLRVKLMWDLGGWMTFIPAMSRDGRLLHDTASRLGFGTLARL